MGGIIFALGIIFIIFPLAIALWVFNWGVIQGGILVVFTIVLLISIYYTVDRYSKLKRVGELFQIHSMPITAYNVKSRHCSERYPEEFKNATYLFDCKSPYIELSEYFQLGNFKPFKPMVEKNNFDGMIDYLLYYINVKKDFLLALVYIGASAKNILIEQFLELMVEEVGKYETLALNNNYLFFDEKTFIHDFWKINYINIEEQVDIYNKRYGTSYVIPDDWRRFINMDESKESVNYRKRMFRLSSMYKRWMDAKRSFANIYELIPISIIVGELFLCIFIFFNISNTEASIVIQIITIIYMIASVLLVYPLWISGIKFYKKLLLKASHGCADID